MYNIKFTYTNQSNTKTIEFPYIVYAESYEEAIALVQAEADDRVQKIGGTIISII